MKSRPLVSILIPSYNHEKYVDDCMKSILAQSYDNLEVIIIDDCSQDKTYEKLLAWKERLQKKTQNVSIVRNEQNIGVTKTLNKMLRKCQGKYIKTIASDDFFLPNGICDMVDFFENHPECGLIFANGIIGNRDTHYPVENEKEYALYYQMRPELTGNLIEKMYENNFIFAPGQMFSREVYVQIGGFDEEIAIEDWDYYMRIVMVSPVAYLDRPVVMYRYTNTSMTQSASVRSRWTMRKSELQVLFKYSKYVSEELSSKLIAERCNVIFKEAFDMRSHAYIKEISKLMKGKEIKLCVDNRVRYLIYKSRIFNSLFKNNGGL